MKTKNRFNRINRVLVLSAFLMIPFLAEAFTSDDLLHPVAHGAGSYMLTHAGQVVCKKITNLEKTTCSVIAAAVTLSVGALVEATQNQSEGNWKKGMLYNASGVALSVGIMSFDF